MNAAIRAVVRTAVDRGWQAFGVRSGFSGLMSGSFVPLGPRDVGGIIQQGGTILGSARCPEFHHADARVKALKVLSQRHIDALIVIGGNGSQTGSFELSQMNLPVVGVASTIDNDLCGSDITIGVDTALNIALEAIDRLKVTAASHQRAFLVEVMGRKCGYLALMAGIAGGAEAVVTPEVEISPEAVASEFRNAYARGKSHAFAVVAEGARYNAEALTRYFKEHGELGFELRATILGHVQRGGVPTAFDRILATRLGAAATECLARGEQGVLVGWLKGDVGETPLEQIAGKTKGLDPKLVSMAQVLAQ
jgi:6-phosphofructokinase 1